MQAPKLCIVCPCFNEQDVLPQTNIRLNDLLSDMVESHIISSESFILYVDDGSRDATWQLIESYRQLSAYSCGLKLAGNVGHQNALMAGLSVAKDIADVTISIDADLQDDISVMPQMIEKYTAGADIVYGVRNKRSSDTFFKRNTALLFYRLMHSLGVRTVYNSADFRLMSRRAVNQLCNFKERNLFLRGIVPLIGYKTDCVYYDRAKRTAGESKYPLGKMLNFAVDGITSFSVRPVRMILSLGIIFLLISIGILIYVSYSYIHLNVVPGWASIILSIWFVGACVLISLGVIGEYIGKIYVEVKNRPLYNIESVILKDKNN